MSKRLDGVALLSRYLRDANISQVQFAKDSSIPQAALSRYIGRKQFPGILAAQRIEAASNNEVPIASWAVGRRRIEAFDRRKRSSR